MISSLADFIKRHIVLDIALLIISVIIIPSLLVYGMISNAMVEVGWCEAGENICLLEKYVIISFGIIVFALFFQFVVPYIFKKYKKWSNKEKQIRLEIDGEFRAFNYVLFAELPINQFPFIRNVECSIGIFPEISELKLLSKDELKRIEGHIFGLPMENTLNFGKLARIDAFVINAKEKVFKIFKSERYSKPPLLSFGNYIFHVYISGRNILWKKVFDDRYLFVNYEKEKEFPEIKIKRFSEIAKDERKLIRGYENRHIVSFY